MDGAAIMNTAPAVQFSHFGIFVFDLPKMEAFYTDVLGFIVSDRGIVRETQNIVFLTRNPLEHHQIVLCEGRTAALGEALINQISLRVESLDDVRSVHTAVSRHPDVDNVNPINHVVTFSVYFADPEGNRVEVFTDSPWYSPQPHIEPLDLSLSNEAILADTEARYKDHPSFKPIDEWREEFAKKLSAADQARQQVDTSAQ